MKPRRPIIISMFVCILSAGCNTGNSDYMQFDLSTANHLEIDSLEEYGYSINTKGNDPYISLKGLNKPLENEQTVLTFEYLSTEGIYFLEVFFLSKETGSFGSNVAGSQKCPAPEPTGEMNFYSVDISESIENYNWNPETDWLRLDFGDRPDANLVIRNIHSRKRNKEENALFEEKKNFENLDKQANEQFSNYLSNTYESFITRVEVRQSTVLIEGNYIAEKGIPMLYGVKPWENVTNPKQFKGVELPQSPFSVEVESVHCYTAALDFLASRYNRKDNKYGRIHHWIMHNEVDADNVWTNMGQNRPLHVFLDAYYKSMRLCYNISRKYDENSEVFASFTHSWGKPVPVDGDYATLDLLNGLLHYSAVEGDFQWGLACHPYPEDLNEPKTWNDRSAIFSMNTPMVTFKNLEVLDSAGKKPVWYLYQAADTPSEDKVFELYKSVIGINDWSEIMREVK